MDNYHGFITTTGITSKGMCIHIYLPFDGSTIEKEKKLMITSIGA